MEITKRKIEKFKERLDNTWNPFKQIFYLYSWYYYILKLLFLIIKQKIKGGKTK